MDSDLYNLYPLENAEVYSNDSDIIQVFRKSLQDFYDKN